VEKIVGTIPQHYNGFLSVVKYTKIFQRVEEMGNIRDIIIVAGKSRLDMGAVRCCFEIQGHTSILCKTVKELIGGLKILPASGMRVSLVIIELQMLINTSGDLVTELSECAPDVPFVLLDGADALSSVEELLSGSMQHLTITGSELSEYIFRTQCIKILGFAKADLLELDDRAPNAQTVLTISYAMSEITDLATQMVKPEVRALAEKAIDLLEDVQLNKQCVVSDAHKKSLFALLSTIKQHVLNSNKIPTTDN
jgi:hypothetical protein